MDIDAVLEINKHSRGCLKKPSLKGQFNKPLKGRRKRSAKKVDFSGEYVPKETKACFSCGYRNMPPKTRELFGCEDCGKNVCSNCVSLPHVQCYDCRELKITEARLKMDSLELTTKVASNEIEIT